MVECGELRSEEADRSRDGKIEARQLLKKNDQMTIKITSRVCIALLLLCLLPFVARWQIRRKAS